MITATNLSKRFGDKRVFDRVDVQLDRGDFLLVTGPNGSGKTTLLRVLAGSTRRRRASSSCRRARSSATSGTSRSSTAS